MRNACLLPRRMNAQSETAESLPAAQHRRQRGVEQRNSPARNEIAMATADACHSTQQLGCSCRRIVVSHCVTPCDPRNAIPILSPFDQPVNKEAVVAQNQDDVSRNDLIMRCALNREQIARPQRGQHARSPCPQPNLAAVAKHLSRKTKLGILASFQNGCHIWRQTTRHSGGNGTEIGWRWFCRRTAPWSRKPARAGMQDLDIVFSAQGGSRPRSSRPCSSPVQP